MILTKSEILTQIAAGNIVILGCSTDSLEDSALDVTMAPVIYEVAENEVDLRKEIKFIRHEIDSDGFTLHPNRFYLGVTNEFTYTPKHKPFYNGRSSCGRSGLASHITAGTGDIGFAVLEKKKKNLTLSKPFHLDIRQILPLQFRLQFSTVLCHVGEFFAGVKKFREKKKKIFL